MALAVGMVACGASGDGPDRRVEVAEKGVR